MGDHSPRESVGIDGVETPENVTVSHHPRSQRWADEAAVVLQQWELAWDALPDSWRADRLGQSKPKVVTEYIWATQIEKTSLASRPHDCPGCFGGGSTRAGQCDLCHGSGMKP